MTRLSGIPSLYFALLHKHRKSIAPETNKAKHALGSSKRLISMQQLTQLEIREEDEDIAFLHFLYDSYEPRCLYFEVRPSHVASLTRQS